GRFLPLTACHPGRVSLRAFLFSVCDWLPTVTIKPLIPWDFGAPTGIFCRERCPLRFPPESAGRGRTDRPAYGDRWYKPSRFEPRFPTCQTPGSPAGTRSAVVC